MILFLSLSVGLQKNKMYRESCGYEDNGRVRTWLPYRSDQYSPALLHDLSQEELLGDQADKYYVPWYTAPTALNAPEVSDIYCDPKYRETFRALVRRTPSCVGQLILVWWQNIRILDRTSVPARCAPPVS